MSDCTDPLDEAWRELRAAPWWSICAEIRERLMLKGWTENCWDGIPLKKAQRLTFVRGGKS